MKTKLIYGLMALFAAVSLASCSDDDEYKDIKPTNVPTSVASQFSQMYPAAKYVEWEVYGQYYVADFKHNNLDLDAWFSPDGRWLMTETDYNNSVASLPVLMQNAFQQSQYAGWFVEDVSLYEKPENSFCEIEVETAGQPETSIFINTVGEIMNIVPNYNGTITPVTDVTLL